MSSVSEAAAPTPATAHALAADSAAWAAGATYWRDKLAGHPRPAGPRPDHRRPEDRAAQSATVAFEIDGELFEQLARLTGGEPFLEHAALAAALTTCLYRYTQASPIVLGCPAMRSAERPEAAANAVPLVDEVDGSTTFRQLLLRVRQTLLATHEHQDY